MGSPELFQLVRAGFVARHTSLAAWCAENGVYRQNAARALKGQSRGTAALALAIRVAHAAGVYLDVLDVSAPPAQARKGKPRPPARRASTHRADDGA